MKLAMLAEVNRARQERRAVAVETDLDTGDQRLIEENEDAGDTVLRAFRTGKPGVVEAPGSGRRFVNVHLPPPRLVVIGAVHISQALAPMARLAGYDVEIVDPRIAFATPERFAGVSLDAQWPEIALAKRPLDRYCALAAITHDPKIDDLPLRLALEAGCFYVGALGSRRTHASRVERLRDMGVGEADIARIEAPIGADIGASSPGEIAVAILSSVIEALRKRQPAAPRPDALSAS